MCLKMISPTMAGIPDRLAILPHGHLAFIELKRPGQKPRPLQQHRINQLNQLGIKALTLDNPANIPQTIKNITGQP